MPKQYSLAELTEELLSMKAKLSWMEQVLESMGIKGPWMSPAKAAQILGISRDRIVDECSQAYELHISNKASDLKYGVHYRKNNSPNAQMHRWQINISEFPSVVLGTSPDRRQVG